MPPASAARRSTTATASATWSSADEASAAARVRELLAYLPSAAGGTAAALRSAAMATGDADPGDVRARPNRGAAYDVRDALRAIVDRDSLLELHPRWARNVVTALARIDGRPVAIVANQPRYLGGVLDAEGSEKAARFVGFCDSFGLPLVAVVDTPGFMPGSKQEAGRASSATAPRSCGRSRRRGCRSSPSCCASPTAAPTSR